MITRKIVNWQLKKINYDEGMDILTSHVFFFNIPYYCLSYYEGMNILTSHVFFFLHSLYRRIRLPMTRDLLISFFVLGLTGWGYILFVIFLFSSVQFFIVLIAIGKKKFFLIWRNILFITLIFLWLGFLVTSFSFSLDLATLIQLMLLPYSLPFQFLHSFLLLWWG